MPRDNLEPLLELLKKHNVSVYKDGEVQIQFAHSAFITPDLENGPDEKKKDQGEANRNRDDRELFYAAEG